MFLKSLFPSLKKEKDLSHFKFLNKNDNKYIVKLLNGFYLDIFVFVNSVCISCKVNNCGTYDLYFDALSGDDDISKIVKILNSKIFTLNYISFELFLIKYINGGFGNLNFNYENKKIILKETKFVKNSYKIKINYNGNVIRLYIFGGYFFNIESINQSIYKMKSNQDPIYKSVIQASLIQASIFGEKKSLKDFSSTFGMSSKVDGLIKRLDYMLDMNKIKVLYFLDMPINIYKKNSEILIISEMKRSFASNFGSIRYKQILKYCEEEFFPYRDQNSSIDPPIYENFFLLIKFSDGLKFDLVQADNESIEKFQLDFFSRFNNEMIFKKLPSPSLVMDMIESGIITKSDELTLDSLSVHEMFKL